MGLIPSSSLSYDLFCEQNFTDPYTWGSYIFHVVLRFSFFARGRCDLVITTSIGCSGSVVFVGRYCLVRNILLSEI